MNSWSRIAIASIVLLAGLLLAWPFRKSAPLSTATPSSTEVTILTPVTSSDVVSQLQPPSGVDELHTALTDLDSVPRSREAAPVAPQLESTETPAGFWTNDRGSTKARAAFWNDNENSGDGSPESPNPWFLAPQDQSSLAKPLPPRLSRNYDTDLAAAVPVITQPTATKDDQRVHLVRDGDTLERLAKRYLGSEQRSHEFYAFNEERLESPDLLPIGLELRIPPRDDYD